MTDQQMKAHLNLVRERVDKLESGQRELQTEAKEIRTVIGGDLSGKPGILQNQMRTITVLFDEKEGLVPRLTAMERRELERKGFVHGAKVMWGFAGAVIGALVMFLLGHFVIK